MDLDLTYVIYKSTMAMTLMILDTIVYVQNNQILDPSILGLRIVVCVRLANNSPSALKTRPLLNALAFLAPQVCLSLTFQSRKLIS